MDRHTWGTYENRDLVGKFGRTRHRGGNNKINLERISFEYVKSGGQA